MPGLSSGDEAEVPRTSVPYNSPWNLLVFGVGGFNPLSLPSEGKTHLSGSGWTVSFFG